MTGGRGRGGSSLVEVMVALVVLEVGLLGAAGLLVLAAARMARATLVERAAAEAASMADSLSRVGAEGSGEIVRGSWRVSWEPASPEGLVVRVEPAGAREGEGSPLVELRVP